MGVKLTLEMWSKSIKQLLNNLKETSLGLMKPLIYKTGDEQLVIT